MSRFEQVQHAVTELVAELAHAEELCDEQAERIVALEAEMAQRTGAVWSTGRCEWRTVVADQRVARLEAENRHLREALILALRFIDPEQHDVIEEIEMTLHGDLDDAVDPAGSPASDRPSGADTVS